jgi:hypothetical protein
MPGGSDLADSLGRLALFADLTRPELEALAHTVGEASVLTGEPPSADVVAKGLLRCVVVAGPDLERFLLDRPHLLLRLLREEAHRLRNALEWRS